MTNVGVPPLGGSHAAGAVNAEKHSPAKAGAPAGTRRCVTGRRSTVVQVCPHGDAEVVSALDVTGSSRRSDPATPDAALDIRR